jgi:poly(beta-D-mannuronate) lyase
LRIFAALLLSFLPTQDAPRVVRTPEELAQALAAAAPGDTIAIADGTYTAWKVDLAKGGAEGKPVVVRPQTPKGVVFTGAVSLRLTGDHLVVRGLRFEGTGLGGAKWSPNLEIVGDRNRVTDCEFVDAAGGTAVYTGIVFVTKTADEAEVDHLTFRGSRTISVKVGVAPDEFPRGVRIHHNVFEDIQIAGGNGGEAIQLGSGGRVTDAKPLRATIEHNVMRRVRADPELISNKSSGNIIRFNRLYDSEGEIVLRGGNDCVVEGNLLVRTDGGIRVCGSGHRIVNNVVLESKSGLFLTYGGRYYDAATKNVVAHNTFHSKSWSVTFAIPNPTAEEKADPKKLGAIEGNTIVNNLFLADSAKPFLRPLEGAGTLQQLAAANRLSNNLFWRSRGATEPVAELAGANLFADPKVIFSGDDAPTLDPGSPARNAGLDGFAERDAKGRARSGAPDLGASETP